MACSLVTVLRTLFCILGCLMLVTLIYTLSTAGTPFRKELLTPWMVTTLLDFYINVVVLAAWIFYKEANWISAVLWVVLLLCLGSITTCAYIIVQLFKIPFQDSFQHPMYLILMRLPNKDDGEQSSKFCSVVAAKALFGILGCWMLGTLVYTLLTDGSPFRRELLTPWMVALLIDFFINVAAMLVWVTYKETSWIGAFFWVVLFICFGSVTTCLYVVIQLFHLSSQDPPYLILLKNSSSRRVSNPEHHGRRKQCDWKD